MSDTVDIGWAVEHPHEPVAVVRGSDGAIRLDRGPAIGRRRAVARRPQRPEEVARAERDPRHRMALVFRWYLGRSVHWAMSGDPTRIADYPMSCGPAR